MRAEFFNFVYFCLSALLKFNIKSAILFAVLPPLKLTSEKIGSAFRRLIFLLEIFFKLFSWKEIREVNFKLIFLKNLSPRIKKKIFPILQFYFSLPKKKYLVRFLSTVVFPFFSLSFFLAYGVYFHSSAKRRIINERYVKIY